MDRERINRLNTDLNLTTKKVNGVLESIFDVSGNPAVMLGDVYDNRQYSTIINLINNTISLEGNKIEGDKITLDGDVFITEGFQLVGDAVLGGILESWNWGLSQGGRIDLSEGTILFGGSSAPKFSLDESGNIIAKSATLETAIILKDLQVGSDIDGTYLTNLSVTGGKLANLTITAAQIANATITGTQIANLAIATGHLEALAVTAAKIANATITAAQIANTTITATQIQALTITAAQIANATITGAKIAAGTIEAGNILNATITGGKIANTTITGGNLVNQTITAGQILNLTITAAQIANLTITGGAGGKIALSTISKDNIVANTITANEIAVATITANEIVANTLTANEILGNTITFAEIAANTITANELNITLLSAITANMGALTIDGTLTMGAAGKIDLSNNSELTKNHLYLTQIADSIQMGSVAGYHVAISVGATDLTIAFSDEGDGLGYIGVNDINAGIFYCSFANSLFNGTVDAVGGFKDNGVAGIDFGPAAPASITVKGGIITAAST